MSKNIFSAFEEKSDSEREQSPAKTAPRPTKKQLREEDKVKREHFGDQVVKDENQKAPKFDGPKNKGDYNSGEKRPFERHSGTGKQAFGNSYKKSGHGKGNVGKPEEDEVTADGKGKEKEVKQSEPEKKEVEPVEEIITLDQYIASTGTNFQFLNQKEQELSQNYENKDASVKLVQPKQKDQQQHSKKTKQIDIFAKAKVTNNIIADFPEQGENKRKNSKRFIKTDFSEKDFPELS